MNRTNLTDDDKGKSVVNTDGDKIGMISRIEAGRAYVDPDPGITDRIRSKLDWESADAEDYPLDDSKVERITDDEVRLKRDF